jgi:hypothetical protein
MCFALIKKMSSTLNNFTIIGFSIKKENFVLNFRQLVNSRQPYSNIFRTFETIDTIISD